MFITMLIYAYYCYTFGAKLKLTIEQHKPKIIKLYLWCVATLEFESPKITVKVSGFDRDILQAFLIEV